MNLQAQGQREKAHALLFVSTAEENTTDSILHEVNIHYLELISLEVFMSFRLLRP